MAIENSTYDGPVVKLLSSGQKIEIQPAVQTKWSPFELANGKEKTGQVKVKKGLSLWLAIVFIVGECAGSGVLALPRALADMGWSSVAVMIICCLGSAYSGVFLARCWIIMEERWEEYRRPIRDPYASIGEKIGGRWMRGLVSFSVNFTLFGVATVYLLLCSQMVKSLLAAYVDLSFCLWILIFAAILCPLMWLGTPEDFWPSAVGALLTTAIACVLLLINIIQDKQTIPPETVTYDPPTFTSFFLSFGTILFTFGGAAAFPTFQNDMKDKQKFPMAVMFGFLGLLILYMPVAVCGYAVFGNNVSDNVVMSVSGGPMKITVDVLLVGHFFFAFLILINPTAQELEDLLKIPHSFNWKRCLLRMFVMGMVVFVAETIPQFGKILSLVGGSTVTLTSFIFPAFFYLKLCSQHHPSWPDRTAPLHEKIYLIISIVIAVIGGAIATYSAVKDIVAGATFIPPCYLAHNYQNLTVANTTSS